MPSQWNEPMSYSEWLAIRNKAVRDLRMTPREWWALLGPEFRLMEGITAYPQYRPHDSNGMVTCTQQQLACDGVGAGTVDIFAAAAGAGSAWEIFSLGFIGTAQDGGTLTFTDKTGGNVIAVLTTDGGNRTSGPWYPVHWITQENDNVTVTAAGAAANENYMVGVTSRRVWNIAGDTGT